MRLLAAIRQLWSSIRPRTNSDVEEEFRSTLDAYQQDLIRRGLPEQEARRKAHIDLGRPAAQNETYRDAIGLRLFDELSGDIRYGLRALRRDPYLALTATLTLSVCIGANTAVFSLADSVLFRPLPYPSSDRIDWISERSGPTQQDTGTAPDYYYISQQNQIFEDVAAFSPITVNWTGVDTPEQVDAAQVSASFFRVIGTRPMLGRYLTPQEEGPKAPAVAVLSFAFWRNRLASDPQIVGKRIAFDRLQRTIVGVMPQGFDFPRGAQVWLPSSLNEASESFPISPTRPIFTVSILARRRPGLTKQQIETDMRRLTVAIRSEYKVFKATGFRSDLNIAAIPLQQHLTGELRPALLVLSGAVGLVLLIGCVNLASLLLARAGNRERELAIRLALGSGRCRIVRQMLTESLVLALLGGAAGIGIAWIALRVLDAIKPAMLVRYPPTSMDFRVLGFTIALTLTTSLLFGLIPALSAAGIHIHEALKTSGLVHSGGGPGSARVRKLLVIGELALSLVLLIGTGLLTRSMLHLVETELGFPTEHLLTFRVNPIGPLDRDYARFYRDVLDRLVALPLAKSAALVSDMPLNDEDFYQTGRIRAVGRPLIPFAARPIVNNSLVSPEFLRTMLVPLKQGRFFDAHDFPRSDVVVPGFVAAEPVVVNEAFVHRIFPGETPLGQRLVFGPDQRNITWTIIGVVGNVRGGTLGAAPPPMVYRCTCSGDPIFRAGFVIRTTGDPKAAISLAERAVRAVDRDQPIFDVHTMEERREASLAPERFELVLAGAFAFIAILLAAAGVYGVMSYLVARRTREIGIRAAMGARWIDVLSMVLGETSTLILYATLLGLGVGWGLTRYIRTMLYGVSETDPMTFTLTPAVLALIVFIASLGPSLRAVQIDPATALREE